MSTLHKVKAYFGMAPMEDYDDEYYEDDDRPSRGYSRRRARTASRTRGTAAYDGRGYEAASTTSRRPAYRGGYPTRTVRLAAGPRDFERPAPRSARCVARPAARSRWIRAGWPNCSRRAARCRRSPRCARRTTARPAPSASASATAPR